MFDFLKIHIFFLFWCSVCYIISYASWNFDWLCDPQSKCFLYICLYIDNQRPSCVLKESWRYCSSDSMPIFSVSCPRKFGNLDRHEKPTFAQLLKQFVQNAWTKKNRRIIIPFNPPIIFFTKNIGTVYFCVHTTHCKLLRLALHVTNMYLCAISIGLFTGYVDLKKNNFKISAKKEVNY